jgi:hypothetical protein
LSERPESREQPELGERLKVKQAEHSIKSGAVEQCRSVFSLPSSLLLFLFRQQY